MKVDWNYLKTQLCRHEKISKEKGEGINRNEDTPFKKQASLM